MIFWTVVSIVLVASSAFSLVRMASISFTALRGQSTRKATPCTVVVKVPHTACGQRHRQETRKDSCLETRDWKTSAESASFSKAVLETGWLAPSRLEKPANIISFTTSGRRYAAGAPAASRAG